MVHVIGGGLAGSEAAWQAASLGVPVTIYEMRPVVPTAVHKTDRCAELVCSNSFRGDKLDNAIGLLKEEMRRLGSLVLRVADQARVPAGAALAVDREKFAEGVTEALAAHPLIRIERRELSEIPGPEVMSPVVIATGPLTSMGLSSSIAAFVGQQHLAFFDAISPIVLAESIDMTKVFRQSRWDRSLRGGTTRDAAPTRREGPEVALQALAPLSLNEPCGSSEKQGTGTRQETAADTAGDYLNCPMTKDEYDAFVAAIRSAEKAEVHDFDNTNFFEGCLPIEVMAHRGVETLRFGPMKAAGLSDPRTSRRPYAVVQLRQDNLAGDHFSLVGFQTQIKWSEQVKVLRLIPGLERAEFVRLGMIHRNTYINAPTVLDATWQTRTRADLFFAGQVSGVEGYVESAASGLIAGRNAARLVLGRAPMAPPRTTAIGALGYYVSHAEARHYQPSNITFGIMPPLAAPPSNRADRQLATSHRALADLEAWQTTLGTPEPQEPRNPGILPSPESICT